MNRHNYLKGISVALLVSLVAMCASCYRGAVLIRSEKPVESFNSIALSFQPVAENYEENKTVSDMIAEQLKSDLEKNGLVVQEVSDQPDIIAEISVGKGTSRHYYLKEHAKYYIDDVPVIGVDMNLKSEEKIISTFSLLLKSEMINPDSESTLTEMVPVLASRTGKLLGLIIMNIAEKPVSLEGDWYSAFQPEEGLHIKSAEGGKFLGLKDDVYVKKGKVFSFGQREWVKVEKLESTGVYEAKLFIEDPITAKSAWVSAHLEVIGDLLIIHNETKMHGWSTRTLFFTKGSGD